MSRVGSAIAEPAGARASAADPPPTPPPAPVAPRRPRPVPAAVGAADPPPATLAAIYDAALMPGRWPDVLAALAEGLNGSAATLHVGSAGGACRITAASGLGEAALLAYGGRCGASDPVVAGAAAGGAAWAGPIAARDAAGAGLERTAFFTGWMRPHGVGDLLCLGLLPPGAPHHATVAVARPPRAPRFGPADAAFLWRLAPHLRRAVEIHRRLSAAAAAAAPGAGPLAEALDRFAAGVALLDAGGAVAWANRPARALLRNGDGLSLGGDGALRASAPGAAEGLRRLVRDAAAGAEGALTLPRPDGRAALVLHAVPLPAARAAVPAARWPLPDDAAPAPRPGVLLLVGDPERAAAPDHALRRRLRAAYGLTEAEAAVAARAAPGVGLPEVARSLGLSVSTARTHAQRVFAKAGVRGQAEWARRAERLDLLRADRPG